MEEIILNLPDMHVFICINDRTNNQNDKPSCGPRITSEKVREIKKWLSQQGLVKKIQVTKAKCLGHCHKEGSVVCVYPQGKFYKKVLGVQEIKNIINQEKKELFSRSF
jgi:(2Fe-2S) ferredoxin